MSQFMETSLINNKLTLDDESKVIKFVNELTVF